MVARLAGTSSDLMPSREAFGKLSAMLYDRLLSFTYLECIRSVDISKIEIAYA